MRTVVSCPSIRTLIPVCWDRLVYWDVPVYWDILVYWDVPVY